MTKKLLTYLQLALLSLVVILFAPLQAYANLGPTFQARVTLDLCPEYKLGGISIKLKYTVGDDATVHDVQILNQTINSQKTSGDFEIELPSVYGALPLHLTAYCYSSTWQLGNPSNQFTTNNCERLWQIDTDRDGLVNGLEDRDCNNAYSPGDYSNPDNVDSDGDGVRDLVEFYTNTDPSHPGNSPRPIIFAGAPFDPDGDGDSNSVVWRGTAGTFFVRDYLQAEDMLSVPFGRSGDIPFVYSPSGANSNVGVIRITGRDFIWYFHGPGFKKSDNTYLPALRFGLWGDNIALGPWEKPGITNPATTRFYNDVWEWNIYLSTGKLRHYTFGGPGDVPKAQDYDGDGIFDLAVFRIREKKVYVVFSSDHSTHSYSFGTGTADYSVRGDVTGDGIDDISFWEPWTALFTSLKSDNGFNVELGAQKNPDYYQEEQLGIYSVHVPLSWFKLGNKVLYTVVDHQTGYRFYIPENNPANHYKRIQWGLLGDSQG